MSNWKQATIDMGLFIGCLYDDKKISDEELDLAYDILRTHEIQIKEIRSVCDG